MSSSSVVFGLPSASLFRMPPSPNPFFLPPPPPGSMPQAPSFAISDRVYWAALDARVPLTIAAVYAVTAKALNRYNRSTGRRPWAISQTRPFFAFVVLHNVFLAVYSAWTWWGMLNALRRSIANPLSASASGGLASSGGLAATVDSLCRLTGAPGLGNGLFFDEAAGHWRSQSGAAAVPSRTQPGRLWNEGLAFYGWLFYLSKFYEVLDTFIILAKGKFSSVLQTYHHAGAMMCMWAGMRYMSAPIWMFVFVNSGIHALMYTYYTLTAFNIRVPTAVKRTLTSMQITQFLVGASFAMLHSFVFYTVPVGIPAAPPAVAVASTSFLNTLKSFLSGTTLQAATVAAADAQARGTSAHANANASATAAIAYRQKTFACMSTSGETFAVWLNVVYLAPLTYLFVKFFITSYLRRSSVENARAATRAAKKGASHCGVGAGTGSPNGTVATGEHKPDVPGRNDAVLNRSHSPQPIIANAIANGNAMLAASLVATTASAAEASVRRRLSSVGTLAEKAGWDAARDLEKEVYGEAADAADATDAADAATAQHQPNAAAKGPKQSSKRKGRSAKGAH